MIGFGNDTKGMHVMDRRQIIHKGMRLDSHLPDWVITIGLRVYNRMGWVDPADGWSYWMDASYEKWIRNDQRKQRSRCSRFARILRKGD
jgi:hypothetical protein